MARRTAVPTSPPATEERFTRNRDPLRPPVAGPTGAPAPRRTAWEDALTASGLNLLAGIWLIIAPWVLGYTGADPKWNDVVFGALVGILALVRISAPSRGAGLSLLNALFGAWVFVAAFVIDSSSTAFWNDFILGIVVFVLAMLSASAGDEAAAPRWRR
jgi:hypothetical protein